MTAERSTPIRIWDKNLERIKQFGDSFEPHLEYPNQSLDEILKFVLKEWKDE